jgi:gluconate 2-dehydrogenase gamma chain
LRRATAGTEMTRTSQGARPLDVPPLDALSRREVLRLAALALGGTLGVPLAAGILAACEARRVPPSAWRPKAFSPEQAEVLAAIVDHILPDTDTPGARALGIPQFIDALLAETYPAAARAPIAAGLDAIDARARARSGQNFLGTPPREQRALLADLDRETFASTPAPAPTAFFRTLKALTLVGYYTTEIGATRELHHAPVPGRYEGCVPLAQIGRTWAV